MSNYTVFPSDDVAQTDGTAITGTSTVVRGGSAKGLYSNRSLLDNVGHGVQVGVFQSQLVKGKDLGSVTWGASVAITGGVADDGTDYDGNGTGRSQYTLNSHGLSVGDWINVTSTSGSVDNNLTTGPQKIVAADANTFTTDKLYVADAGTIAYLPASNNHNVLTAEKYVIRRVTDELAGASNTNLRSGASAGYRRSIHKIENLYTRRVATAIRAGYWNEYSGTWSTAPTNADDLSTMGTDEAATPSRTTPGELVYKEPRPAPVQDDYSAKTGG